MKITLEHQIQGKKFYNKIIDLALTNNEFKENLINEPENTILNLLPKEFIKPEGLKITAEDQSDINKVFLNIPSKPNLDEFELTDEQLGMVAGGIGPVALSAAAIVGLGALFVGSVGLGFAIGSAIFK